MAFRLGVDVGGTFTDLFLVGDNGSGAQYRVKTPSTPGDPSEGVLVGVRRIREESGIAVGELRNILHGTTVATNAVLESKGARVGLITTKGFAQILHLARSQTQSPFCHVAIGGGEESLRRWLIQTRRVRASGYS